MKQRRTGSIVISSLFFTILQPGFIAGLIPYWILGIKVKQVWSAPFGIIQYLGMILFIIGFCIMMECILRFAFGGRGTLSPAVPTQKLVVRGLYKYFRNPMYAGVVLTLLGEALFLKEGDFSTMYWA